MSLSPKAIQDTLQSLMRTETKYDLYAHNTMRLHCVADTVLFPENAGELVEAVREQAGQYFVLAGGSNVILPAKLHKTVILLSEMRDEISVSGNKVECSSSVRIQKLIRIMQGSGLGGMEYLFSVPCTVGGAVYMNAGRAEIFHQSISDFVLSVECFDPATGDIVTLNRNDCKFAHRHSVFSENGMIILKVILKMDNTPAEQVEAAIHDRITHVSNTQDGSKPSAGSVFKYCNSEVMSRMMGLRIGGACWSVKTQNWISNDRKAKNWHVMALVRIAQLAHKLRGKSCCREVIIVR